MATEAEKVNSPKFEIYLGGVELSADQAKQLEATLQKATMRFLAGMDAAPKAGDPQPAAPFTHLQWQPNSPFFDRRWWFGWWIIRDLRAGGRIQFDLPVQVPGKIAQGQF